MSKGLVVKTFAISLKFCTIEESAKRRAVFLQNFIDGLDKEDLDVVSMTEAMGSVSYPRKNREQLIDYNSKEDDRELFMVETGTVYTFLCRKRYSDSERC